MADAAVEAVPAPVSDATADKTTDASESVVDVVAEPATTTNSTEDVVEAPASKAEGENPATAVQRQELPQKTEGEPEVQDKPEAQDKQEAQDKPDAQGMSEVQDKPAEQNKTEKTAERTGTTREDKYKSKSNGSRDNYRKRPYQDYRGNVKSDVSTLKETDDPVAIRKQVEFYFSDSNLAGDKFLFGKVGGHENNAVPIEVIHSFKRMRHFQPFSAVVAALKDSTVLDVVDDDTAIKRKTPLAEGFELKSQDDIRKVIEDKGMARSVYVKGFGDEEPTTQFDIEAFFAPYGATNQVRLRRDYMKRFKGSVFVEFDSEETQQKFLELDPKPTFGGKDLIIKSKKQYCDEKVDDINNGRVRANEERDGKGRRQHDDRDWRERRDEDRKNGFRSDRRGGRGGGRGGHRGGHRGGRGRQDGNSDMKRSREDNEDSGPSKKQREEMAAE